MFPEFPSDNYAKDGGQGRSDFCVDFTSLCVLKLKEH